MGHNDHIGVSHFDPHVYSYHYFFFNLYKLTLLTYQNLRENYQGGYDFIEIESKQCDEALMHFQS